MNDTITCYQHEMVELAFCADPPVGSHVAVNLFGTFTQDGTQIRVPGFYAGDGRYAVRFLPHKSGPWRVRITGIVEEETTLTVLPARDGQRGVVHAEGTHFVYNDGTPGLFFGTTVYALLHQTDELIDETMKTLSSAPFNKIRICVFPKDYRFNRNEPKQFAFEKDAAGGWDTDRPCFSFWEAAERRLEQLFSMGFQVDLILFHPYDRWGFSSLSQQQNLTYLDYLLRRWMAYPAIWWSMANEYDLCPSKTLEDWYGIEAFVHNNDRFGHLLSNHGCLAMYDASRPYQTHLSWQTKQLGRIPEMLRRYGKPIVIDECCYEGDLPDSWGAISGQEMTARFWRSCASGAFCTHGETFDPGDEDGVVWWSKGGVLRGESPAHIAFCGVFWKICQAPLNLQQRPCTPCEI